MRKRKVGLDFFNAGGLNEAIRIELVGERQRGDSKTQQRKNRTSSKQARTGQNGLIPLVMLYSTLISLKQGLICEIGS